MTRGKGGRGGEFSVKVYPVVDQSVGPSVDRLAGVTYFPDREVPLTEYLIYF